MCDKGRDFLLRQKKNKNKMVSRDLQWKFVKDRIDSHRQKNKNKSINEHKLKILTKYFIF